MKLSKDTPASLDGTARSPSLLEGLVDCATRQAALETALVAHVLLNSSVVDGRRTLSLSPAVVVLLEIIRGNPACARMALLSTVRVALRFARHCKHHDGEPRWQHILYCEHEAGVREVLRLASMSSTNGGSPTSARSASRRPA